MNMRAMRFAAVAAALSLTASVSLADQAENTVKYRKNYMTSVGGHVGAIFQLLKGEYVAEGHMQRHADAVAATVIAKDIETMFPEGTMVAKTHALESIWENWDDFAEKAAEAEEAAKAFKVAVDGGDQAAIGKAAKALGGSCRSCHDDYKERED